MFTIKSKNEFIERIFLDLLYQKKFLPTSDLNSIKYNEVIKINLENNQLKFSNNQTLLFFLKVPVTFENVLKKLTPTLKSMNIIFNGLQCFPFSQKLVFKDKITHLGSIHITIFTKFLLSIDTGIDKKQLYQELWPGDKDIYINKLDTHLTNLKNKINSDLSYDLKFTSSKGRIYLISN